MSKKPTELIKVPNELLQYFKPAEVGFGYVEHEDYLSVWRELGHPYYECPDHPTLWIPWPRHHCPLCGRRAECIEEVMEE